MIFQEPLTDTVELAYRNHANFIWYTWNCSQIHVILFSSWIDSPLLLCLSEVFNLPSWALYSVMPLWGLQSAFLGEQIDRQIDRSGNESRTTCECTNAPNYGNLKDTAHFDTFSVEKKAFLQWGGGPGFRILEGGVPGSRSTKLRVLPRYGDAIRRWDTMDSLLKVLEQRQHSSRAPSLCDWA